MVGVLPKDQPEPTRPSLLQRVLDDIWLWLFLNIVIFFTFYLLWGWTEVFRVPVR